MAWKKHGCVFTPRGQHPKLLSHAANPLAVPMGGDVFRIFYSARDAENRSSVGAVDMDVVSRQIVAEHEAPFFTHGPTGSYYEIGVSIGNAYRVGDTQYIGFMGWQKPANEHWRGEIGQLQVHDDLTLTLDATSPLMGIDSTDPISLSYPWVMRDEGMYRMWYGSTLTWDSGNGEMLHVIHQAHSTDGKHWQREGIAVPYTLGEAQAFSRPTVVRDDAGYHMWFSYRGGKGSAYRIGYAHSVDGVTWQRQNTEAGITVSAEGWDSEMICYPFVFDHAGERYMLYCGNGYGKTGFGIAQWM